MNIRFNECDYQLERYPDSDNHTLQAVSAADEYLLRYLEESGEAPQSPVICHDRFGALSVPLHLTAPIAIIEQKSQEISIQKNLTNNGLSSDGIRFANPLEPLPSGCTLGLIRVPKSLELFRLYVQQLSRISGDRPTVICSFMTRHFSPKLLAIANEFFGSVQQSKAWKKSRLLILSDPKPGEPESVAVTVTKDGDTWFRQYPGVFSAQKIDSATRLLIDNLDPGADVRKVLDLGCGNGVIAAAIRRLIPEAEVHLLDDSWLAVESAKLNLEGDQVHFHWSDAAKDIEENNFDLLATNPPFHLEYEIDLTVPLSLFRETRRILRPGGVFLLVANRHLNYRTHLMKLFEQVTLIASDDKYEVLRCE